MSLITGVEMQQNFPTEDISDDAAGMLELLLLNRELVNSFHTSAEMIHFLYRLGHKTLELSANPRLNDGERRAAFSYGIGAYEAVATLVRPQLNATQSDEGATAQHIMAIHASLDSAFVDTLVNAKDRMQEDLPRTTYVIGQSAARFCAHHADYALSGAAIARELEVSALAA